MLRELPLMQVNGELEGIDWVDYVNQFIEYRSWKYDTYAPEKPIKEMTPEEKESFFDMKKERYNKIKSKIIILNLDHIESVKKISFKVPETQKEEFCTGVITMENGNTYLLLDTYDNMVHNYLINDDELAENMEELKTSIDTLYARIDYIMRKIDDIEKLNHHDEMNNMEENNDIESN